MTTTEQNIALAKARGWRFQEGTEPSYGGTNIPSGWINPKTKRCVYFYPKCTEDLNACHSVLQHLTKEQLANYRNSLAYILCKANNKNSIGEGFNDAIDATAAQRSEALCRTLWPDRFKAKQKRITLPIA